MPDVQIALLVFIMLVVGIGGGWFVYESNRSNDE